MLVTGTKNKNYTNGDKLKANARSAFGSTVYLKPKITPTTTTVTNNINNQGNKNKNNVTKSNKDNKSNKMSNNNSNNSKNSKLLGKPKNDPYFLPTYARPTIATTARYLGAAKSLNTNIKGVQNMPKPINTRDKLALDQISLLQKSNTKQTNARPNARLTGGYASTTPYTLKEKSAEYAQEFLDKKADVSTQANDREILDYDLMVGDFKILLPSADLVSAIDRERKEQRRQQELMQKRKLDANTEQRAKHLTDLKEFLESGSVTRRSLKSSQQTTIKNTLPKTKMDYSRFGTGNKLGKQVHKSSSILSIKSRIKQKENELLSLFDNVTQF